ncbi:MAG: leucine-rich repeat domain-containing protein [Lachnospiraceae bacterium]|nr:leucine-rich repeat domain-containing protein [Lachnospiraceae bacterium]
MEDQFVIKDGKLVEYHGGPDMVVPEGVTEIASYFVSGKVETVFLPAGLQKLGYDTFDYKNTREITVSPNNETYKSIDGIVYSKDGQQLICCPPSKAGKVEIPEGTKKVGFHAFSRCGFVTEISLPSSLTELCNKAFYDCSQVSELSLPGNIESLGDDCFPCNAVINGSIPPALIENIEKQPVYSFSFGGKAIIAPSVTPMDTYKSRYNDVLFAAGFCISPSLYDSTSVAMYEKYLLLHRKTMTEHARERKISQINEYYKVLAAKLKKQGITDYSKLSELKKVELLEKTVYEGDLAKIEKVYSDLGKVEFSARILGFACRYLGLDYVKVLVKYGATFSYTVSPDFITKYKCAFTCKDGLKADYELMLLNSRDHFFIKLEPTIAMPDGTKRNALSETERSEILDYLLSLPNNRSGLNGSLLLYYAIINDDLESYRVLKKYNIKRKKDDHPMLYLGNTPYICEPKFILPSSNNKSKKEIQRSILTHIFEETADCPKADPTDLRFRELKGVIDDPELLKLLLDNIDYSKINQISLMEHFIDTDNAPCLSVAETYGFMGNVQRRDKLIKYAETANSTAAIAWLLDYKNRTADFAAEEAKEERKIKRMLSENPASLTAMRREWFFYETDDHKIVIDGYKGKQIDITVPDSISGKTVIALNSDAFSPEATRLTAEKKAIRRSIQTVRLPAGITHIPSCLFNSCTSLREVSIPSSVSSVGMSAFHSCVNLVKINVYSSEPNNTLRNVKEVGQYAFAHCEKLDATFLPEGIFRIGQEAFEGCAIKQVIIPEGVRTIEKEAFLRCQQLTEIKLPSSLEVIEERAFAYTSITSLEIPENVQRIEKGAFDISTLKSIRVHPNNKFFRVINGILCQIKNNTVVAIQYPQSLAGNVIIPAEITAIQNEAFKNCSMITDVTFEGKCSMGSYAFSDCKSLSKVTLPEAISDIPFGCFQNCISLGSIKIPDSVTNVEVNAFKNCSSLKEIELPDSISRISKGFLESLNKGTVLTIRNSEASFLSSYFAGPYTTADIIIRAAKGSTAESFCKEATPPFDKIKFEPLD